jgi:hypothetical protein
MVINNKMDIGIEMEDDVKIILDCGYCMLIEKDGKLYFGQYDNEKQEWQTMLLFFDEAKNVAKYILYLCEKNEK